HAGAADPGFDARGVELVSLITDTPESRGVDPLTLSAVIDRIGVIPGVERVSAASAFPGGFEEMRLGALRVPATGRRADDGEWTVVMPGYFDTIRMPLRAGRDFAATDGAGGPRVAVIGEGTARRLWPNRPPADAVGAAIDQLGFNPQTRSPEVVPLTIVGIAADPAFGTLIDGRNDVHV